MAIDKKGTKQIADNRKARHDYFVLEQIECGIELVGTEVKSIRNGGVNLKDSWCSIEDGEMWVKGMHISPYEHGNIFNRDPRRSRLASCTEIESIDQFIEMLIDTAPGEHAFDKEFGCEIFYLDFESIISHTRWEGQFSDYITQAITRYEKRLTNVNSGSLSTIPPGRTMCSRLRP